MKHYETVTETVTQTVDKYIETTCDICGANLDNNVNRYHECTISYIHYYTSSKESFEPDICVDCFEGKVLPLLRSIGLKVNYKEEYD